MTSASATAQNPTTERQIFAHRVRILIGLVVGSTLLFGLTDPWFSPQWVEPLWQIKLVMLLICAGLTAACRGLPSTTRSCTLALLAITTSTFGSAFSGAVIGLEVVHQMICMTGILVSSILLPWSASWQAGAAVVATAAILTNVALVGVTGYPMVAAVVMMVASVYLTAAQRERDGALDKVHAATESSERFLRQMTDQLPALIAYLDTERRYRFVNRALAVWARRTPEAMLGARIADLTEPSYVAFLEPHIAAALAGERRAFEIEVPDPNDEMRCLAHVLEPNLDDDGTVRGFFSLARDVTDTKRAEEAVRRHQAELAHVQRLTTMGEMVAALAHELNQPLQAIAAYAVSCGDALPADLPQAESLRSMTTFVSDEALRAGEIIRRLQRLARKADPKVETVEANGIVQNALRLVRAEAEQSRIQLEVELAPNLPAVRADAIQIEQVLVNLLLNAMQAVDRSDGQQRRILTRTEPGQRGGVRFCVEDSGPGVAPEALEHIFEPYFTTRAEGLGMGLAISRSILDAHEGSLTLAEPSAASSGACFCLWLPPAAAPNTGGLSA